MKNVYQYYQLSGLENIYLEDSFIKEIIENQNRLIFHLDLVLTEKHPFYTSPKESEVYCYKNSQLIFFNCSQIIWATKNFHASMDANNEIDFGNIDTLTFKEEEYHLSGDWGDVKLKSDLPKLFFID